MRHSALSDPRRLRIVDTLATEDLTVADLADLVGLPGNLLAHHLQVLESAGLIERRISEGDHRRRYVTLRWDQLPPVVQGELPSWPIAFVCTRNSARSQFAAAWWTRQTGVEAASAGSHPAPRVHPVAIEVAFEYDIDLTEATPAGYEALLSRSPELIVSVCDRALESGLPVAARHVHWSVPDPVKAGKTASFRAAFQEIAQRIDRLSASAAA